MNDSIKFVGYTSGGSSPGSQTESVILRYLGRQFIIPADVPEDDRKAYILENNLGLTSAEVVSYSEAIGRLAAFDGQTVDGQFADDILKVLAVLIAGEK